MSYLFAILAGLIQGVTEFLPISSSGHLLIFHEIFGFQLADNLAFDAVLHLATFFALAIFFWTDIIWLVTNWLKSFQGSFRQSHPDWRLPWLILIGVIPAAGVGYFFESVIETSLRSVSVVGFMLLIFGAVLLWAEQVSKKGKSLEQLSVIDSLFIGISQVVSFIPGVSRSGITIIAGLNRQLQRAAAARFSFLLALPLTLAAGAKKALDLSHATNVDWLVTGLGFFSALISGYLCIKYFLHFVQKHSLKGFAFYRIILGIVVLVYVYIK